MKKIFTLIALTFVVGVLVGRSTTERRRVLLENEQVRVNEVILEPNTSYPAHTHALPHVGVIIKGGTLEFTEGDQKQSVEFKAGDAGWRAGGVTHSIRNASSTAVHVVEVELKAN